MTATAQRTMDVHYSSHQAGLSCVSLTIRLGDEEDEYHVRHAHGTTAVRWTHDEDDSRSYVVRLANGRPHHCNCPAHQFRGAECRHIAGTTRLIQRNHLPGV
jgi:hypothetical protein